MPRPTLIKPGQVYGRLTVIMLGPCAADGRRRWVCHCECGGSALATQGCLLRGNTRSCGCYKMQRIRESKTTHGGASSDRSKTHPLYSIWSSMRNRCNNPAYRKFCDYGGRGIRVDPRWDDFALFLADMGPRPSAAHSIERNDVNGDYTPSNCRWATVLEQANNKRGTLRITASGVTKTVGEWARDLGTNTKAIRKRLLRGWTPERAVTAKVAT